MLKLDDNNYNKLQKLIGNSFLEGKMTKQHTLTPTQIVMYTTEYCSDCLRVKKFFEENNVPYERIGLEGNPEATEFVIKINNGFRSVPTIVFPDGSILVEPSWEDLKQMFN
jgi:mycoredoxin